MKKNKKGNALIELIMVMVLLIIFGASISILIFAGGETQQRIIAEKNARIDARVALNYMNMYIRQHDGADRISVAHNDYTGENAILVRTREDWGGYDTWIFWSEGIIYECIVDPGEQPSVAFSFVIAEVMGFEVDQESDGSISVTVRYTVNDREEEMQSFIFLRSGRT
jgi:type II secretory pathway pseudopilin PulG